MEPRVHNGVEMWNKEQTPSSPGTQPPVSRPASTPSVGSTRGGTVIGETMRIKGEIYSNEEMHLDGQVEGRLETRNRLTIGPKGKADASITAAEVVVSGSIRGNVDAAERIVLHKGANLVGDVKTAGIVIEDGAYFKGGIDIARPETAQAAAGSTTR
jgi:cytoskeletal protein CcmA (bactofilin family)